MVWRTAGDFGAGLFGGRCQKRNHTTDPKMCSLCSLPIHVWEHAWLFLLPGELCELRFVCKEWYSQSNGVTLSPLTFMKHISLLRMFRSVKLKTDEDVSGRFRACNYSFRMWILYRYAVNQWTIWKEPEDFRDDSEFVYYTSFPLKHLKPRGKPPNKKEWCHECAKFVRMDGAEGHVANVHNK